MSDFGILSGIDALMILSVTLSYAVAYIFVSYLQRPYKNLPPGPINFPLVGCLPTLAFNLYRTGEEPEEYLAKLAKRHGEVISLKVGTNFIVVANGCKSIKEAFQNPRLNDRPRTTLFEETSMDEGIAAASGMSWTIQHRLVLNTFRKFSIGTNSLNSIISREAETLVYAIRQQNRKPFNPKTLIGNCVSNVVCPIVFGKQYEHSDPEFKHLLEILETYLKHMGAGGFLLFLPILRYVFPQMYQNMKSNILEFKAFVDCIVKEHESTFDTNEVRDFIEVFLSEIELNSKDENGEHNRFMINRNTLLASTTFIFLGGSETPNIALRWVLLYMMTFPEVQAKVQRELDAVVGRNRMPEWADRFQLPYTEAVLLEIQRVRTIAPLGFAHVAGEDTKLAGYDVPKGSLIVSNLWAVHNDPEVWTDPDQFRPERFLDENGMLRVREEFMPFGTGRRICLGENIAKMEIFIFVTNVLHSFDIKNPHPDQPYSMKGVSGLTFSPVPFEIQTEKRA